MYIPFVMTLRLMTSFVRPNFSRECNPARPIKARGLLTPQGGGVLPYMGYIGMYGAKGYGILAVLVWNRVSILPILI